MVRRSMLFSPGDRPEFMRKAPDSGADSVIFDLEDAVAPARKADARETVHEVLTDPAFDPDCEVCVRLNPSLLEEELSVLLDGDPRVDTFVLPKVESAADVERVAAALDDYGSDCGLVTLAETARGVLHAEAVADADRVEGIIFGSEDLSADVGATPSADGDELLYARQHVVLATSAADVDAIDTVYTDIEDREGLAADTRRGIDLGYDGRIAIHPAQVPVINEAFTPEPDEVEWAERVLAAAEEAEAAERGVFRVDGEMIDAPLVRRAERVVERASAAGGVDE
ncbi:MAG: CoA ester lyase [Haloarculaceae archaeon]